MADAAVKWLRGVYTECPFLPSTFFDNTIPYDVPDSYSPGQNLIKQGVYSVRSPVQSWPPF